LGANISSFSWALSATLGYALSAALAIEISV
jgi:hypothetical protein